MGFDITVFNIFNFTSINYLLFLPLAAFLYFKMPAKHKNTYLLFISYFFYIFSEIRLFFILPISTILSFTFAKMMHNEEDEKKKKNIFILSIVSNLGILLVFKYYGFFAENFTALTNIALPKPTWILPLGISFFTFSSLAYLIDVYLKKIQPEENFITYSLFLSLFCYVTSGPIVRANDITPQLSNPKSFDENRTVTALQLMAIGYFKKIAVADVLIKFINQVHLNIDDYSGIMLIFTAFIYSFWLYADFSGYSDIARGTAKILGIEIVDNFNTPYLSQNMSGFWARWHISLSTWFQDYIFMPIVWQNPFKKLPIIGSFYKNPPLLSALAVVFLTSGLWHGAAWTFILWGACHALFRIIEDLMRKYYKKPDKKPKFFKFWGKTFVVFTLVSFSQIFFASHSVENAFIYISKLFSDLSLTNFLNQLVLSVQTGFDSTPILIYFYLAFCFISLCILINMDLYRYFKLKGACLTQSFLSMKPWLRYFCYYALIALIFAGYIMNNAGFGSTGNFLYQNF